MKYRNVRSGHLHDEDTLQWVLEHWYEKLIFVLGGMSMITFSLTLLLILVEVWL